MKNIEENKNLFEFESFQTHQNSLQSANFPQNDENQFIRSNKDTIELAVRQFLNNEEQNVNNEVLQHFMFDSNIVIDVTAIASAAELPPDETLELDMEQLNQLIDQFKEKKKYFEELNGQNVKIMIQGEIDKMIKEYNKQLADQEQEQLSKDEILNKMQQDYWLNKRQPIFSNIYQGGHGDIQLDFIDENTVTSTVCKYSHFMKTLLQQAKQGIIYFTTNYIKPLHQRDENMVVIQPQIEQEFQQTYQQSLEWWRNFYQTQCAQNPILMEQQFQQLGPVHATLAQQGICEILSPMWQSGTYETSTNDQFQHYPNQPPPLQAIQYTTLKINQLCCKDAQQLNVNRSEMDLAMKDEIIRLVQEQTNKCQLFGSYLGMLFQIDLQTQQPQDIQCGFNEEGNFVFPAGEIRQQIENLGEQQNLVSHFVNIPLGTEVSQQKIFSSEQDVQNVIKLVTNTLLQSRQFKVAEIIQKEQNLAQILQNLTYSQIYNNLEGKIAYNTRISAIQSIKSELLSDNSNESLIPDICTEYLKRVQQNQFTELDQVSRSYCKLPTLFTQYYKKQLNPDAFNHFLSFNSEFVNEVKQEGYDLEQADSLTFNDVLPYIVKLYICLTQESQLVDVITASDDYRNDFLPRLADIIQILLLDGTLSTSKLPSVLQQLKIPEYCWIYLIQQFTIASLYKQAFMHIISFFAGRFVQCKLRSYVRQLQEFGYSSLDENNLWFMSEFNQESDVKFNLMIQGMKEQVCILLSQFLSTESESTIYEELTQFIETLYYNQSYSKVKLYLNPQILFGYDQIKMQNSKETVQLKRQFLEQISQVCGFIVQQQDINFIDNFKPEQIVGFYATIDVQNIDQSIETVVFGQNQAQIIKKMLLENQQQDNQISLNNPTTCFRNQQTQSTSLLLHQLQFIIEYRGKLNPDQHSMNVICSLLNTLSQKQMDDQIMNLMNTIILKIRASIEYQPIYCKLQFYKTYINVLRQIQLQSPNIQRSSYKALFFEDNLEVSRLQNQFQTMINIYLSESSIEYVRELVDLQEFYQKTNQLNKALEIAQHLLNICETYYQNTQLLIDVEIINAKIQYKAQNYIKSIKCYENAKSVINSLLDQQNQIQNELNSDLNLLNAKINASNQDDKQILIKDQQKLLNKLSQISIKKNQLILQNSAIDGLISQSATQNGTADLYQTVLTNSIKIVNQIQPEGILLCDLMNAAADILISQNKLLDSTVYLNFIVQKQKNLKIDSETKFANFKKLILYTIKAANKDVHEVYKQILASIELNEIQITEQDIVDVVRKIIINENPQLVISEWFLDVIQSGSEQSQWKLIVLFMYINQCEIYTSDDTVKQENERVPLRYNELLTYDAV